MASNLVKIFLMLLFIPPVFALEVESPDGKFEGKLSKHSFVFNNIPFAQPPVGNLRWKAPRALVKASKNKPYASIKCAQIGSFFSGSPLSKFNKAVGSEDCLYLNISTPKNFKANGKKPVFVWLYGGSNRAGLASDPLYQGANLAASTDAVVVAINYRLGHFGAFYNKILHEQNKLDNSGNFVTLDIIAALDWIHKNIHEFGGDKNNITLGGQSAGCINVWGAIMTPLAKNKFKRAYCSAGIPNNYPIQIAQEVSNDFISNVLVSKNLAKNKMAARRILKKKSHKKEVRKLIEGLSTKEVLNIPFFGTPVQHISDGHVFPKLGLGSLLTGNFNRVELMTGANALEGSYFLQFNFLKASMKEFWQMVNGKQSLDPFYDVINSRDYRKFMNASQSVTKLTTELIDYVLHATQLYLPKIYRYSFEWKSSHEPWRSMYGPTHGIELPFLFKNFEYGEYHFLNMLKSDFSSSRVHELSDTFSTYMKGFLHTGNPNEFLRTTNIEWGPWKSARLSPEQLIFGEQDEATKYVYPNLFIGMDALKVSGHILTHGLNYRPKN